ncbi:BASS family transporter [Raphidocelis subcapitata]|uniref:BASS family transporter n=1 Tax=Raphidocelis subcapitata TaxID=307507 RepID=A0A2V0NQ34_9CHLO|nr:BASS family transporter [Raphidocelis subcapitata]|eukprot:GBF89758.1 BASS family transporter [Raphidocelis subcapitata]
MSGDTEAAAGAAVQQHQTQQHQAQHHQHHQPPQQQQPQQPQHKHNEPQQAPQQRGEWAILAGSFVSKNFLPVSFLIALTIALAWPVPGAAVMKPEIKGVRVVAFVNSFIVFLISGLQLRTAELKGLLSGRGALATAFGSVSILGITPLLAFALKLLPFKPREFATGLAIFATVPTTLGVGISLVTSAKGNGALAILLTTFTNAVGVALIPLWLKGVIGKQRRRSGLSGTLSINYGPTFVKLMLSCLAPSILGKLLRTWQPARRFATRHRVALSMFSNANLAVLIWQTVSASAHLITDLPFGVMLLLIVAAILLHVVYLIFNAVASAPVAITVINFIASSASTQGLLAVPCIVGQLVQIFMDQPIANYLGGRIARWRRAHAALPTVAVAAAAGGGGGGPHPGAPGPAKPAHSTAVSGGGGGNGGGEQNGHALQLSAGGGGLGGARDGAAPQPGADDAPAAFSPGAAVSLGGGEGLQRRPAAAAQAAPGPGFAAPGE